MKKIIAKPHLFFFGLCISFTILGIINKGAFLDINIGDTFYVVGLHFWFYISAIFFALIGLNYFSLHWAEKTPNMWLTLSHLLLQSISLLLLLTKHHWNWVGNNYPKELNLVNNNSETVLGIAIILFIISILVHLIIFFTSLFLKKI